MNKADLISSVAEQSGLTNVAAKSVVDTVFGTIQSQLTRGEKVTISGFGSFDVVHRKARQGRNPKTGEAVSIPARRAPKFTAGKNLKESLAS